MNHYKQLAKDALELASDIWDIANQIDPSDDRIYDIGEALTDLESYYHNYDKKEKVPVDLSKAFKDAERIYQYQPATTSEEQMEVMKKRFGLTDKQIEEMEGE